MQLRRFCWANWEARRIYGWADERIKVGDFMRCQLKSGKIASFRVIQFEPEFDPGDMFNATLSDVGYVDVTGEEYLTKLELETIEKHSHPIKYWFKKHFNFGE